MNAQLKNVGRFLACCLIVAVSFCGCEQPGSQSGTPKNQSKTPSTSSEGGDKNSNKNTDKQPTTDPNEQEAKAGVGKKGKSYGGGMITEPASQYWNIKEKLAFGMVKKAEDLHRATNGKLPKTHDEYMKIIIDQNKIELPDLDEGLEYHYDAEKKTLMVRSAPE